MKIGVVGCGALGSYYGAKLWQAGQDVHFLLRSDYDVVREHGVFIETPAGNFTARPCTARTSSEIGVCDLVVIGLKTTANHTFPELLPPLVGPHTMLLTLQNGLGNEEALAKLFSPSQIFGGLCFVCLNRLRPGYVLHTGEGNVLLGEFQRTPSSRVQSLVEVLQKSGIKCSISEDLEKAHWEKLVWNIAFNGLGVAGVAGLNAMRSGEVPAQLETDTCLTTNILLSDMRWEALVRGLMLETIHAAARLGFVIPEVFADKMIERTRKLEAYQASTLVDFERGQPLELESLFFEPLRQAQRTGAETPLLKRLCAVLTELDRRRAQEC